MINFYSLLPIVFTPIAAYSTHGTSKLIIGCILLLFSLYFSYKPSQATAPVATSSHLITIAIVLFIGFFSSINSKYFSLTSLLTGIQFFIYSFFSVAAVRISTISADKMAEYFQITQYLSFIIFVIDTLLISISTGFFTLDAGVPRFAPSLGPSAGSIYLLSVFTALIGLPRATSKIIHNSITAIVITLIILTGTRISLIAMLITTIYLHLGKNKQKATSIHTKIKKSGAIILFACIIVLFLLNRLFFNETSAGIEAINTNGRLVTWIKLLNEFLNKPWLGHGWGSTSVYIETSGIGLNFGEQPHNDYIRLLFETGVIGLSFFIMSIILLWRSIGISPIGKANLNYKLVARSYLLILVTLMMTDNVIIYHFYTYASVLFISFVVAGRPFDVKN